MVLDEIVFDFGNTKQGREIKQIIHRYRDLSETQLITVQDLLSFMLALKSLAPTKRSVINDSATSSVSVGLGRNAKKAKPQLHMQEDHDCRKFAASVAEMGSRWPAKRLEFAARKIVEVLEQKKATKSRYGGISRKELRDAAQFHVGDTGLLDLVTKSLQNVTFGKHFVNRHVNLSSGVLEYTIQELTEHVLADYNSELNAVLKQRLALSRKTRSDIYNDVIYLYRNVLLGYPESRLVHLACRTVLDSKHFVKEWQLRDEDNLSPKFICKVMPSLCKRDFYFAKELPPAELIVVSPHATIGELKEAAESALRDSYCVMEHFSQ